MYAHVQLSAMPKFRKPRATSLSERMRRIRSRDTAPEWIVRRTLWRMGYRYRLHVKSLPGTPDIVFARRRKAVFVHGCFWHGHDCPLFRMPGTRQDFWSTKIERNRARDRAVQDQLAQAGWRSMTVWECAIRGPGRLGLETAVQCIADWMPRMNVRTGELRASKQEAA